MIRMDWDFLKQVMAKMGFDDKWIHWMSMCVESVDYSVLVNNEVVRQIIPGRCFVKGTLCLRTSTSFVQKGCPLLSQTPVFAETHLLCPISFLQTIVSYFSKLRRIRLES
jgi:hypothetical protein